MNQYMSIAVQLTQTIQLQQNNTLKLIVEFKMNEKVDQRIFFNKLIWYVDEVLEQIRIIERTISLRKSLI